jgi:hypothetical protein
MKRYLYILLSMFICQLSAAQDAQRFFERSIMGTARYVGMGGAMTAIGGDPTAVMDNPAGLGLYRRNEIAMTIDETIDRTQQLDSRDSYQRERFMVPNVAGIMAWGSPNKQRGMIFNNFMFSYNRLASFNRDIVTQGTQLGMVQTICNITNGLPESNFDQDKVWEDTKIAWLSILGYDTYLINPTTNDQWTPVDNFTNGSLSISESGNYDQYTFSWASNINNQWYVGLSLNVPTLSYTKNISILETNRINSAELKSMYYVSGVGVSGSIGLIYRPIRSLRIGASFHTPTVLGLSVQTEGDMYSTVDNLQYETLTPASGVQTSEIVSPLRTSFSVAGQIGNEALISLQYDYAHSAYMEDLHTLRIGAEAQAYRGLFFNAGYVYESSFLREDPIWMLAYNEIRTDMDYRYTANTQYASVGMGYRGDLVVAQMAYQYGWQTLHQYASEMQMTPMQVATHTHRIVATLAWRF